MWIRTKNFLSIFFSNFHLNFFFKFFFLYKKFSHQNKKRSKFKIFWPKYMVGDAALLVATYKISLDFTNFKTEMCFRLFCATLIFLPKTPISVRLVQMFYTLHAHWYVPLRYVININYLSKSNEIGSKVWKSNQIKSKLFWKQEQLWKKTQLKSGIKRLDIWVFAKPVQASPVLAE